MPAIPSAPDRGVTAAAAPGQAVPRRFHRLSTPVSWTPKTLPIEARQNGSIPGEDMPLARKTSRGCRVGVEVGPQGKVLENRGLAQIQYRREGPERYSVKVAEL